MTLNNEARLPTQQEFDAACRVIARCNGHDLDVWTGGEWPSDEMKHAIKPALSRLQKTAHDAVAVTREGVPDEITVSPEYVERKLSWIDGLDAHEGPTSTQNVVDLIAIARDFAKGYKEHAGILKRVIADRERIKRERNEAALRPEEAAGQGEAKPIGYTSAPILAGMTPGRSGHFYLESTKGGDGLDAFDVPLYTRPATPRPAPVAPDIVPVAVRVKWGDKTDGYPHKWQYIELPMPDAAKAWVYSGKWIVEPLHGPEALAALSSKLATAERERDGWYSVFTNNAEAARNTVAKSIDLEERLEAAEAEVARLTAREKELLEALEPFAAENDLPTDAPDERTLFIDMNGLHIGHFTVLDLRRARSLQPAEKE